MIRVGKFAFPVDFVILDMDKDCINPLILGRHFLATARALTDSSTGELTLRVGEEKEVFTIPNVSEHVLNKSDAFVVISTIDTSTDLLYLR